MSLTLTGLFVAVLAQLLALAGHTVSVDALNTTLNTIVEIVGAVLIYVGRYRHGDINIFGLKV